jgi:transcription elongation factor Elf1
MANPSSETGAKEKQTRYTWWCELCGARGEIVFPLGIDVYSAVGRIYEAHAAASGDRCQRTIRIRKGEEI